MKIAEDRKQHNELKSPYEVRVKNGFKTYSQIRHVIVILLSKLAVVKCFNRKFEIAKEYEKNICSTSKLKVFKDIVMMAHFDPNENFSEADKFLVNSFKELGFEVVVVSTAVSGQEKHDELWNQIHGFADCLITKPNSGFDFGSWAAGINHLDIVGKLKGHLILINNSIFGPMFPLDDLLADWKTNHEILGITSSNEFVRHVQSYFLGFKNSLVKDQCFKEFWSLNFTRKNKWNTILDFEIRWADFFSKRGFSVYVRHETPKSFFRNPLTFRWLELLADGMPFVKKSLLTKNYDHIETANWKNDLGRVAPNFPTVLIELHVLNQQIS